MKSKAVISDIGIDYKTAKPKVTFLFDSKSVLADIENLKDIDLSLEVKKWRNKRSLDANAYFWKLLSSYSAEKEVDTIQEYKDRVKRLGIFKQFKFMTDQVDTFMKVWTDRGIAWFCEILDTTYIGEYEFKIINAYYGSSSYNTKQMSRLINDLVEDCKEVGIETRPEAEIVSMLKEWEGKDG